MPNTEGSPQAVRLLDEPTSLEQFIAVVREQRALGNDFWRAAGDDASSFPIDSIATLELLVMLEDLGVPVNFMDTRQLSQIRDLRTLYLAYLTWAQMP